MKIPTIDFDAIQKPSLFHFIRHGQSEGNRAKQVQGHTDMPLVDQGRSQARAAGLWLKSSTIDLIISSPLSRARETAGIIAEQLGIADSSIVESENVKELDTGIFSGKTFAEVEVEHNEAWRAFRYRSWEAVPQAERIEALMARASDHWNELIRLSNSGKTNILTVTHGGFFQWLFKASFGFAPQGWMPLIHLNNCGLSRFFLEPVKEAPPEETGRIYAEWQQINFTGF